MFANKNKEIFVKNKKSFFLSLLRIIIIMWVFYKFCFYSKVMLFENGLSTVLISHYFRSKDNKILPEQSLELHIKDLTLIKFKKVINFIYFLPFSLTSSTFLMHREKFPSSFFRFRQNFGRKTFLFLAFQVFIYEQKLNSFIFFNRFFLFFM